MKTHSLFTGKVRREIFTAAIPQTIGAIRNKR